MQVGVKDRERRVLARGSVMIVTCDILYVASRASRPRIQEETPGLVELCVCKVFFLPDMYFKMLTKPPVVKCS